MVLWVPSKFVTHQTFDVLRSKSQSLSVFQWWIKKTPNWWKSAHILGREGVLERWIILATHLTRYLYNFVRSNPFVVYYNIFCKGTIAYIPGCLWWDAFVLTKHNWLPFFPTSDLDSPTIGWSQLETVNLCLSLTTYWWKDKSWFIKSI